MGKKRKCSCFVRWSFFALATLFLSSNCGTSQLKLYTGSSLPKDKIATLSFSGGCPTFRASIVEFDGKKISGCGGFFPTKCLFHFLPGEHKVYVNVGGWLGENALLDFFAEAGHEYDFVCNVGYAGMASTLGGGLTETPHSVNVYIIDLNSKEVVSTTNWK